MDNPEKSNNPNGMDTFLIKRRRMDRERDENRASSSGTPAPASRPGTSAPTSGTSGNPSPAASLPSAMVSNPAQSLSWQETKGSIKERTSCLVNSEKLSDITFLVGPNETPIYGHKTILSAGSPYFEKLFFGPMASNESIHRISDIEPDVLVVFLKVEKHYLYTDEFDDSMDDVDALMLLKPAKIYIVPHLAQKCADLLIDKMSPENVFLIYNRAIVFDEPKLAQVCLRFLDRQIDKVITTEEFLDIDAETLATVLSRENLRINECVLFKAVLKWAIAECKRRDLDWTQPENQRQVLDKCIYLIRFPAMTREEFSLEVVPKEILTKDEVIGIFMCLCIGNEHKQSRPETPFITERRVYRPKLHYLTRFADVLSKVIHFNTTLCSGDSVYNSSVRFRTDTRVFVHGVGIYALSSTIPGLKFSATVSLFRSRTIPTTDSIGTPCTFAFGHLLGSRTQDGSCRNYDFRMPFQVMFDRPLEVRPEEDYNLSATLKIMRDVGFFGGASSGSSFSFGGSSHNFGGYGNQIDAYYGTKGLTNVNVAFGDGIKVNFTFPTLVTGESFSAGQIPQIIISI